MQRTIKLMTNEKFANRFALSDGIYLLNHSVGRMPKQVSAAVKERFLDAWSLNPSEPWPHWLTSIDEFKNELAALFNAQAKDFCPQSNLTSGLVKVLGALLREKPNATLLASENDFPSMGFALKQAERMGMTLKWVAKDQCLTDLSYWNDVLQTDIDVVLISHVHYNTNTRVPVKEICKLACEKDIFSVVDIAQSAGIVPIDLSNWHADVVLGSCVKWLCGGPGAGFLWAGSEKAGGLQPLDVGWFSHADPFEFDIHEFTYANNASRFWGGTPSIIPYVVAASSIAEVRTIGVDTIYAHNRALTQIIIDAIHPDELVTPLADDCRGGTLVVNPVDRSQVEQQLLAAGVHFDSRAFGLRLSPHIYNSTEELSIVAACFR